MDASLATPNSVFRFKDGTSRNTARISKAKWEEHKELLCSLYQEKTINEILAFMQKEYGFIVNAGQLGRKLREWGVYKYDNKNRPLNPKLPPSDHRNVGRSFKEALSHTVSGDLPNPLDFGEVLPEYEGGSFLDTRLVEHSGAATTASNHISPISSFTQVRSAQDSGSHEEDAAAPIRVDTPTSVELPTPVKLPTVMNEPDHKQLSDFDMDRLSAISITSSEISGFSSLLSLAQRIRLGQTGGTSSGRDSVSDLPSSAMGWDRRISSLYLFGRRSITSSIASSQMTSSSQMSWRPEIPATHNPSRSGTEIEPMRIPRRPGTERRQTMGYPVSGQITYPYESGRRRDLINQPLSPRLTRHSDSPGFSRWRESQGPPPEWYYPDEFDRKDRVPEDYVGLENRLREDDLGRREERSRRRESQGPPPEWYYPDEFDRKDRAPEDYVDLENRLREDDLRRQEERSRRREGRGPPPEWYYPDEFGRKDRAPEDYVDPVGLENRLRENGLRRQDERSRRREGRGPSPECTCRHGARYGADIRPNTEGVAWRGNGQMRTGMGDISEGLSSTRFNKQLERGERRRSGVGDITRADRCI